MAIARACADAANEVPTSAVGSAASFHRHQRRALRVVRLLHIYGGLFCCPWLVVLGVSSLDFNHRFAFMRPSDVIVTWTRPIAVHTSADPAAAGEDLRDRLAMSGWTLPWETRITADGSLRTVIERPGRRYTITASLSRQEAQVEEVRTGWWPTFNALHGMTRVPNLGIATVWGWYATIATAVVIAATLSGVVLWTARVRRRRGGWMLLGCATVASLALIAVVVARG